MRRVLLLVVAAASAACAVHPLSKLPARAERNRREYAAREAFLVADADWRTVLQLVPVAVWTERPTFCRCRPRVRAHPALVYHLEEGGAFDADAVIHFLQQYRPTRVTFVGEPPLELYQLVASAPAQDVGAGLRPDQVRIIGVSGFRRFWNRIESVVYVEDDYGLAALAATYASLLDLPLVVDRPRLPTPAMPGRAICVGRVSNPTTCTEMLDAAALAKRYVQLAGSSDLVAMNPRDLSLGISGAFQPERSALPIATTFSRLSLAAPFLASSRHAFLARIPLDANDCGPYEGTSHAQFDETKAQLDSAVGTLFGARPPRTLAIVASPQAIPYWSDCGNSYAGAADWQYGAAADGTPGVHVGRIYALTSSDTSAHVARSIFYGELSSARYADAYTGLAIAAPGFPTDQTEAQEIADHLGAGGYTASCFTATGAPAQPSCGSYTAIASTDYQGRQIVTFADHGSATSWAGTLDSAEIPWLDYPASLSLACDTNNFWAGGSGTFGPNWIRRGGISYLASIPSTDGITWQLWWAQDLTGDARRTSGDLATRLMQRPEDEVKRQYILLGDPALRPRSKKVGW